MQCDARGLGDSSSSFASGCKQSCTVASCCRFAGCSDGADAGDEDESETGFRVCSVSSDVPALLRSLYEARRSSGEVSFLHEDGREVETAHLSVLQLQSPVLKAMLCSQWKEASTHQVKLQEDFAEVFPLVLRFWYGLPVLVETFEVAVDLRRVAQYYEAHELKVFSAELIADARPTAPRMASVVEKLSFEEDLLERAWAYLEAHPRELFSSSAWLRLSLSTLADFLRRDEIQCREPVILRALGRWARARLEEPAGAAVRAMG
ncbi:unnamed protein product [Cladocopium goreaui]|uniref:Kelch-like ECH-associated protein 1 n=1 Tax=Cladocopium goreaui TaxID=2562237 RepID=A0A9P1BRW4_9DINO|nr:unnamed protein product [Cladocopium goreaui]